MADEPVVIKGVEEVTAGLTGFYEMLEKLALRKELSERSQTIAAVHDVFDDMEESLDAEEVKDAYVSSLSGLRVAEFNAAVSEQKRSEVEAKLTQSVDKVAVAIVDARDLIATGEFREDVATAPWTRTR